MAILVTDAHGNAGFVTQVGITVAPQELGLVPIFGTLMGLVTFVLVAILAEIVFGFGL